VFMASFWGSIVKGGEAQNVQIPADHLLSLTNAALVSKGTEPAKLYVTVDRKYFLATLTPGKTDQVVLDLTFFPEQRLSFGVDGHGEVHLVGSLQSYGQDDDDDDSDGDHHLHALDAGDSDDGSLGPVDEPDDFDEDGDDEDDDDADELPKPASAKALPPAPTSAKKPGEAATTPQTKKDDKKAPGTGAKQATTTAPQTPKTPAAASATPTPAQKRAAPSPAGAGAGAETPSSKKAKQADTPKSGGVKCEQCPKTLPNAQALEQHVKAKHK